MQNCLEPQLLNFEQSLTEQEIAKAPCGECKYSTVIGAFYVETPDEEQSYEICWRCANIYWYLNHDKQW